MKQGDNINYDVDATYDMTIIILEKNIYPRQYIECAILLQLFLQRVCYKKRVAFIRTCYTKSLKPMLYISSSEAVVHAHIRILVQQPTLYISSSEAALHTTGVGLRRRETHSPTHSWCNSLCCTFLPARLLCTPTDF